ncbi:Gp49 family protein, partial [Escherichia coli]|uniref:Gp49 family protein n=1 Tax=Escherichia coli TaxID=562 RepID=UPI003CF8BF4C
MAKTFKCNFYKETDKIEIDKGVKEIEIRPSGEEHGNPWKGLIFLTPEDAIKMANHLKQLASEFGVEEPELPEAPKEPAQTKVTPEQIAEIMAKAKIHVKTEFGKCTVVTVQLENGFTMTESSGCVDPANYDVHLGMEICLKRIQQKEWELEGYA